jgi:hypothetical protein
VRCAGFTKPGIAFRQRVIGAFSADDEDIGGAELGGNLNHASVRVGHGAGAHAQHFGIDSA